MPTVRSLEFKQVSLSRPVTELGTGEIKGRDKDEKLTFAEKQSTTNVKGESTVVRFDETGRAEVSEAIAEALVEEYPQSVWIEGGSNSSQKDG